ncbi:MAG TPA: class I SAM-dependent methyltransferase [Candidatus Acidoferrales bacterium]|nr:class I SAM-dependent methyltransferase [Candidatus Acidoferrales bacterium]
MSFTYYTVDTGIEASQIFWSFDSVADHMGLCDYETTLPVFLNSLPLGEPILDAGCGLARWVFFLRQRGFQVVGTDYAHGALVQAQRAEDSGALFTSDTQRLPIRDASLGGIISLGVVEHDPAGPVAALRELHRVLRPGGIALVAVPYNNPFRRILINHLRKFRDWQKRRAGLKLDFAEYRFSAKELSSFLREAGFEVLSVHADDFVPPLGKGLWVDSSSFFGYRIGLFDMAPGRKRWELNRRGRFLQGIANAISPWTIAAGVLAVAKRV